MPSLKDIRRRIESVKNTQQVTRAMKLVAAAKLRRAYDAIVQARPYAEQMGAVLSSLARRVGDGVHPLLDAREERRVVLLVVTSDRGLCGGFNSNLLRRASRYLKEDAKRFDAVELGLIGRKGTAYFRHRNAAIRHAFQDVYTDPSAGTARRIGETLVDDYEAGGIDAVYVLYNAAKSAASQKIALDKLLPIDPSELPEGDFGVEHIYEPDMATLLDTLLSRHVETQVYRVLLESIAAELGARMAAMEAASQNASEMIDQLTLEANRARQAMITKELLEIVSGAEAL